MCSVILSKIRKILSKLFRLQNKIKNKGIEIETLLSDSYHKGKIDHNEFKYVHNIFQFDNRIAREIMVPRKEMSCLYLDKTTEENLEIIKNEKYTRFPVVEDNKDNIKGIVHTKKLFLNYLDNKNFDINDIIQPPVMIIDSMPINKLLKRMQNENIYMVFLMDEYGGISGLVTIEDILEEIVGDIHDEFDTDEKPLIQQIRNNVMIVDGKVSIKEINSLCSIDIPEDDIDTIGGWLFSQFIDNPNLREIDFDGTRFKIIHKDNLAVYKVQIITK